MKNFSCFVVAGSLLALSSITLADGKSDYDSMCAACHNAGVAGSPKVGDKDAWVARVAKGKDTLYANAISGFQGDNGYMPPKGGFTNLSDDQIKAIVDHMVSASE